MVIRLRTAFFIFLGIVLVWFLYLERAILTPFILAAIFAYVFNPLVNFLSDKIKLPRTLSVIIIYTVLLLILGYLGMLFTSRILDESSQLRHFMTNLVQTTKTELSSVPDFLKPTVNEALVLLESSKLFQPGSFFAFFPQAISRIVSLFIFLVSGFYFLKEGSSLFDKILHFIPHDYKIEVEILLRKINAVLGGYLRGQLFLVLFVSLMLFIGLSVLGVKFALILAIFSGFAEIVPLIGPIVAGFVAVLTVLITGGATGFSLSPFGGAVAVVILYFVVRQFEDYVIVPHIMGKITKLHPLIILFSVLAGQHLLGILGLILAVPIAATIRLLLEFSFDVVNGQVTKKS